MQSSYINYQMQEETGKRSQEIPSPKMVADSDIRMTGFTDARQDSHLQLPDGEENHVSTFIFLRAS